jgi:hypothetical protein
VGVRVRNLRYNVLQPAFTIFAFRFREDVMEIVFRVVLPWSLDYPQMGTHSGLVVAADAHEAVRRVVTEMASCRKANCSTDEDRECFIVSLTGAVNRLGRVTMHSGTISDVLASHM